MQLTSGRPYAPLERYRPRATSSTICSNAGTLQSPNCSSAAPSSPATPSPIPVATIDDCATRKILINDEERSGLLDRPDDRVTEIERQQRADVDDLDVDVRHGQVLRGLERDATQGSVRDDRDVCALTQQLWNTERQRELA